MLAGGAVADDLDLKAGGGGLLNDLADGQADERGDLQTLRVGKGHGLCWRLRCGLLRGGR